MILELILLVMVFLFMQMSHPISMGVCICITSVPVVMIMGHWFGSFWFSYLSFLVLLGAILVLFMYVSSLVSNEIFSFINLKYIFLLGFFFVYALINEYSEILSYNMILGSLGEFYGNFYWMFMGFLIGYLFFTLLICVSLVQLFKGPLREMI